MDEVGSTWNWEAEFMAAGYQQCIDHLADLGLVPPGSTIDSLWERFGSTWTRPGS